jgi:hypothetical protein
MWEYRDNRGLRVPDERIEELLRFVGKTEKEVVDFLGNERMCQDGFAYYFLDYLATQDRWYRRRAA